MHRHEKEESLHMITIKMGSGLISPKILLFLLYNLIL